GIVAQYLQSGDDVYVPPPAPLPATDLPADPDTPASKPIEAYVSASAYAVGLVASVDITSRIVLMTLNDGSSLSVDVPAGVRVHRSRTIGLTDVKVGDRIFASGYAPMPDTPSAPGMSDPGTTAPDAPPNSGDGTPAKPEPLPIAPTPLGPFSATYIRVGDIG